MEIGSTRSDFLLCSKWASDTQQHILTGVLDFDIDASGP